MVRNVHERLVPGPLSEVGPLLDRLGGPDDVLWPSPAWMPMVLDGPLAVGTTAGHGPVRYRVTAHEPGRRLEFTFDPRTGVRGTHTFTAESAGPDSTVLRHDMVFRLFGATRLTWPLAVRWMHDSVLEELLDNAERAVGTRPARPVRRSPWVRLLQSVTHAAR
ncbi:SRPBCC family protein [Pseudonocardia xinjiangensis]|uniref:SRPBCC family protein n=1 Tax=Pseudonocardia xinjiangensis TaxID=75289 RepID=A0ABX1RJV6_9PSEU|nr:SRPBCC family protein [Pseudonocardia xinjiangensis]NMH80229.1 SRPBCC family protein [Pseudonocardia xinjiangensis]